MAEHARALLEPCDIGPDGDNLTGDVLSKNGRVVERPPGEGLYATVDRVDGNGMIPNQDLVFRRGPKGGGLDLERLAFGSCEPGRGVGSHDMRASRLCCGFEGSEGPDGGWRFGRDKFNLGSSA